MSFDKIDQNFIDNVSILREGGGGTGKNYVTNPVADDSTSSWFDGTGVSVDLTAIEPLKGEGSFSITTTDSVASGFIECFLNTFDLGDINGQPSSIQFDFRNNSYISGLVVEIYDNTNSGIITPSIWEMPQGMGKYAATWSTTTSDDYSLHFRTTGNGASGELVVDNFVIGPNEVVIGAAVSDWQSFTMTIDAVTIAPTKATTTIYDDAYWRRVGDSMEIVYTYYHTDNTGTGAGDGIYLFEIPGGHVIDSSKINVATTHETGVCGVFAGTGGTEGDLLGEIEVYNTTALSVAMIDTGVSFNQLRHTFGEITAATVRYSFRAVVPIASWAANVYLANSRVEYVYNTDDDGTENLTDFATGAVGVLVPDKSQAYDSTGPKKRVQFSKTWKHVWVEIQWQGSGSWVKAPSWNYWYSGNQYHQNIGVGYVSDTQYDIRFGGYGVREHNAGSALAWNHSSIRGTGTRWRVVGCDNPLAVESPAPFLRSYDTGWVNCSDWTGQNLGDTVGGNVNHALGSPISDLLIKVIISTDGTDNNSFEILNAAFDESSGSSLRYGYVVKQIDVNNIDVQTGPYGILLVDNSGKIIIDTENWYYKIKVYKLT